MKLSGQSRKDVRGRMKVPSHNKPDTSFNSPKKTCMIGCWNVRTMYSVGKAAQVAKEMRDNKCEILGLSEVRWNGFGQVELTSGESVIFSGREDNLHRQGVGIMMSKKIKKSLIEWKPVNERIILARFYSKFLKTTVIQVYAPTEDSTEEEKDVFYEQLQAVLNKTHKHDIKIVMGDFNAKVGKYEESRREIMGRHGVGTMNNNGEKVINFCEQNNLVITGTCFPHKRIHLATWKSPDGKITNQIDHVLISQQHRTYVMDTRVMRGADVASDHYLLRTKIRLKLQSNKKIAGSRKKFNTSILQQTGMKKKFAISLKNRFEALQDFDDNTEEPAYVDSNKPARAVGKDTVQKKWKRFTDVYQQTAEEILGYKENKSKPWISGDSWQLIEERRKLKAKIEQTKSERIKKIAEKEYRTKDRFVKRQLRRDKREWTDALIGEAENASEKGQLKTVYDITKIVCNQHKKTNYAVKDRNGNLLTAKTEVLERWKQHFEEILNKDQPQYPVIIPDNEGLETLNVNLETFSSAEIRKALKQMKNGKAPGMDNISVELLKTDPEISVKQMKDLFETIWNSETVPQDWKKGIIIKIPKKGDTAVCGNYRGINLLSVPSKVFTRIILNRLYDEVNRRLRNEQAGFRKGRNTTEQIFILRNIIEQSIEWQSSVYVNFIDFEKAFDSVHQDSLWQILRFYGIPNKIVKIIRSLYEDAECSVIDGGSQSAWFKVKTGVRQGCNLSGFLFLLVIDWIMRQVTEDKSRGIRWKITTKLEDLDFADDIALISSTFQHMQEKTDRIHEIAKRTGLKINQSKTKLLRINSKQQTDLVLDNQKIENVEEFVYLGATVSTTGGGTEDMKKRISKASQAFRRLSKTWNSAVFSRTTKVKLFNCLVKPVLLYGCETWKMTDGDNVKIDVFQTKCLRRIYKIFWPYIITNEEILKKSNMRKWSEEIKIRRWKWIGHILRREHDHLCMTALTWAPEGKRKVGRPKTTWRRTVEKERNELGWQSWKLARKIAQDKKEWLRCIEALCATGREEER